MNCFCLDVCEKEQVDMGQNFIITLKAFDSYFGFCSNQLCEFGLKIKNENCVGFAQSDSFVTYRLSYQQKVGFFYF